MMGEAEALMHWAALYIGRPWEKGAQGPDAFDCWGFVRFVQARHFGRELPIVDVDADRLREVAHVFRVHPEHERWRVVSDPAEGDCVLLAHARFPSHIGVWCDADAGGVLHCVRGSGVIFSSAGALKLAGWGRIEFFRFIAPVHWRSRDDAAKTGEK